MGSADWMPRNLDRRVEVAFPVDNPDLKKRIVKILDITLNDTIKARVAQNDGIYRRKDKRGKELISSQMEFYKMEKKRTNIREYKQNPIGFGKVEIKWRQRHKRKM